MAFLVSLELSESGGDKIDTQDEVKSFILFY